MAKLTITDTRDILSLDPQRAGLWDRWVWYTREGGAVDLVTLPAESATVEAIREAIRAKETLRASIVGTIIEVR